MIRRLVLVIAVAFLGLTTFIADDVDAAAAASLCESLPGASLAGGEVSGSTPVVLVHGFTGSKASWFAPIDRAIDDDVPALNRSFVEQLLRIDGVSVWLFDYHETSARWVTDPSIGGALAEMLQCLSDGGAQPAVIAAHSMGGLAARQAMSELGDPSIVSGLVTFATPHFGSDFALEVSNLIEDSSSSGGFFGPITAAVRYSLQLCGETKSENVDNECGWLNAVPPIDSEAGRALLRGSKQLDELPPIPDSVDVLGLAGQIEIAVQDSRWGFFYETREVWPVGDLIVSEASAISMSDRSRTWTCRLNVKTGYAVSDDARQLFGISYDDGKERGISTIASNPCYHGNLTRTVEITNEAIAFISDIAERQVASTIITFGSGIGLCRIGGTIDGCIDEFSEYEPNDVGYGYWFGHIVVFLEDGVVSIIEVWPPDGAGVRADGPHFTLAAWELPPAWFVQVLGEPDQIVRNEGTGEIAALGYPGAWLSFENRRFLELDLTGSERAAERPLTLDLSYFPYADRVAAGAPVVGISDTTPLSVNSMGGVTVGMSLEEAGIATAQTFDYDYLDGYCFFAWLPGIDGLSFAMAGYGTGATPNGAMVRAINIRDPRFATDMGITVGDSEEELIAALGDRLEASPHEYVQGGTYYDLPSDKESPLPLVMRFTVEDGMVVQVSSGYEGWATLTEGCS